MDGILVAVCHFDNHCKKHLSNRTVDVHVLYTFYRYMACSCLHVDIFDIHNRLSLVKNIEVYVIAKVWCKYKPNQTTNYAVNL